MGMNDPYGYYGNISGVNAVSSAASAAAQQAYYNAMASGQTQDRALAQAKFEWQKKLDEAGQTGMWNGQWNNPQEQWFTGQFGEWYGPGGAPQVGQQTLTAQQQAYNQAYQNSAMFGQYYAPGTAPTAGQTTQAAQQQAAGIAAQQAGLTGWYYNPASVGGQVGAPGTAAGQGVQTLAGNEQQFTQGLRTEQEARAAQNQQQTQTQAYLDLLSRLRGPADWAKYQQVLGSTPGGMRDLAAAAMGQYVPGGGATTGYQPQAASLQSMMGQVGGYNYNGQGGGQLNQPSVYNYNQGVYGQPNQQVWGSGIGVGQQGMSADQAQQATGNGTNMYGGQQNQYNLPAPNQISAQSWKNMAPSQQQMLLGQYEANGWDKNDVTALFNQSLPKYGTNQSTAGTWRLQ